MDGCLAVALLRHGMTDENERPAYIGWTDSPLNEKGREMVRRLSNNVKEPDLLFSSSSTRCLETAGLLFPGKKIAKLDELKEMHFGDWEGKTHENVKDLPSYRTWLDDPFSNGPDGGETFQAFEWRVQRGWCFIKDQILAFRAKHAAVVTHGGVIRLLLSALAPVQKSFFEWKIPPAGGYELVWTAEGFRRGERCISLQEVPIMEKGNG